MVAATDMGRREARFYAGPAHEAPLRIPKSYYAAAGDDPTEYVIVRPSFVFSGDHEPWSPGPMDSHYLFKRFSDLMRANKRA